MRLWFVWFLFLTLSLISLIHCFYDDCDDLQSRLDSHRLVLHRGMHKEVHAASLRPNNDSVIVKRGPSKALQRELDIYDSLVRRATFVPRLWGFCHRSSDMLFVQERVIPLAYASMCISLLGAAARILFARRLVEFVAQLIQRDLLHCDFHRGQIGVRLLVSYSATDWAQFVLLDAEQLTRASEVNRALNARCSTDSQCQALIQCYSMHRSYPDQRCTVRRCGGIIPATALVRSLADLMEPLLILNGNNNDKMSRESKALMQRFPELVALANADDTMSRDDSRSLTRLLESMRKDEPTQRISIDRVLAAIDQLGAKPTLNAKDQQTLQQCIGMEDEFAIQSCKDQKYC
jgi:hypothetical protein